MKQDTNLNPNGKRRWGYSGTETAIEIGKKTVGETGGVDHLRTERGEPDASAKTSGAVASKSTGKAEK